MYSMDRCRCAREGDEPQHLRVIPKQDFIPTHEMLSAWWLHLLYGLVHCVISTGEIEQFLVMTNNHISLG